MSRSSLRAVALSVVLVLGAACSGQSSGEDGSSTGSATGGSVPTGATAATGSTAATPLVSGPLEPGTYTYEEFGEPLTLTLGEGWEALVFELDEGETPLGPGFVLFNADHPAANLAFVQPTRVVDPEKDWDEEGNIVPVPDNIVAWFADHPLHDAGEPFEMTIGGRSGRGVDIVVAEVPKNGWPGCGGACVLWFPLGAHHEDGPLTSNDLVFAGADQEVDRIIVVEVAGQQMVVDIGATDQKSFDAFLPLAEEVLATVQFG